MINNRQTYTNDGSKGTNMRPKVTRQYKSNVNHGEALKNAIRSATSSAMGEASSELNYQNEKKGLDNLNVQRRTTTRHSQNSTMVNDGGGFRSQRNAQDRAYANAYRSSMNKRSVKRK